MAEQTFTVDFSESENVTTELEGEEQEEVVELSLQPFGEAELVVKKESPYVLKFRVDYEEEEVDIEDQREYLK